MKRIGTVLVVDDTVDIRESICDGLELEGYRVLSAANGLEALTALRSLARDVSCVILLDLMMPVMSGWDFLEELRQQADCSRFPVIVISASARAEAARKLPCVVDALAKPFEFTALLEVVKRHTAPIGAAP